MSSETPTETRERILKAATKVFIEKGKYGARMQEIASEANINKAMLHYYFKDKMNLYEKSLEYFFARFFKKARIALDEQSSGIDKICKIITLYIDSLSEDMGFARIMAREMADEGKTIQKLFAKMREEQEAFLPGQLLRVIEEAKKSGEFRDVDTVQTIISILGMAVFYFVGRPVINALWEINPGELEEFLERRKRSIADLIIHGLRA